MDDRFEHRLTTLNGTWQMDFEAPVEIGRALERAVWSVRDQKRELEE